MFSFFIVFDVTGFEAGDPSLLVMGKFNLFLIVLDELTRRHMRVEINISFFSTSLKNIYYLKPTHEYMHILGTHIVII